MKKLLLITTLIIGMSFAQEMELWFECSYDYCDLYGTGNSEISVLQIAGEFWELDIYSIEPIGELADEGFHNVSDIVLAVELILTGQ